MKAASKFNTIMADLQQQIAMLNERLQSIIDEAPKAESFVKPEPTAEVLKAVKKLSNETYCDSLLFWKRYLNKGQEDEVLIWRNGVITSYGQTDTKNPIAVFQSRHKARLTLRKAGWDVPFAYKGYNCGKFVVVTRK